MQPQAPSPRQNRAPAQPLQALHIAEARLKMQVVTAVTGLSESSIRRKVAQGLFPAPIKDGTRCTRWVAGQVSNWLSSKGAAAPAKGLL